MEQAVESGRDDLANDIANKIKEKSDWKDREYGAVIIRNSEGALRTTVLFRGSGLGSSVNYEFSMSAGETIVASVHNHTNSNYNNPDGPSDGDWDGAKEWVDSGLAQANSYAEYVLSPTGSLAEFDYVGDFGKHSARSSNKKDAKSEC